MTPKDVGKLWDFLSQTWGNKFLEEYGSQPNDAWKMALQHITLDAARFAIRGLINEGQPFAPTLPEFISHCRRYRPEPTYVERPQGPRMSREQLRDGLDALRKSLDLPPRKTNTLEKL